MPRSPPKVPLRAHCIFQRTVLPFAIIASVTFGLTRNALAESSITPAELASLSPEVRQYFYERPVKKRALVIGIADYISLSPIPSATFDAESFGGKLESLGFAVDYALRPAELGAAELWNKIRAFQNSIQPGALALFYFSGHGFQYGGLNFLAPRDMPRPLRASELTLLAVPVDNIIGRLREQRTGLSILILDACRGNEATIQEADGAEKSSGSTGLAAQRAPPQLILALATQFGGIAVGSNSPTENSIYTKHLNKHIDRAGMEFVPILRSVARDVHAERSTQQPEFRLSVAGSFYPKPDLTATVLEEKTWFEALRSKSYQTIKTYLYDWPVGRFSEAARKFLDESPQTLSADLASSVISAYRPIAVSEMSPRFVARPQWRIADGSAEWALETTTGASFACCDHPREVVGHPEYWELSDGALRRLGDWRSAPFLAVTKRELLSVRGDRSIASAPLAELKRGDTVRVLSEIKPLLLEPGRETENWFQVEAVDAKGQSIIGFVENAFLLRKARPPEAVFTIHMVQPTVEDVLARVAKVRSVTFHQNSRFQHATTEAVIDLRKIREIPELGSKLGDLSQASVEINVLYEGPALPTGPILERGRHLPRQAALLHAMTLRNELIHVGATNTNISITTAPATFTTVDLPEITITKRSAQ